MYRLNILSIILYSLLLLNNFIGYEFACNCPSRMCCSRRGYCGAGCQAGKCWSTRSELIRQKPLQRGSFHGRCTYYNVQGRYTACGTQHSDNEYIAALNAPEFDPYIPNGNPNHNSLCNLKIQVNEPTGSVIVRIVDRCASCPHSSLDL